MENIEQKIQELCKECNWLKSLTCVSGCKEYNHLLYIQELNYQIVADAALDNKMTCEDYDGH